jgi:hypothetical protein
MELRKTVWCWHKYSHVDRWERSESPEASLYVYDQMVFHKSAKTTQ